MQQYNICVNMGQGDILKLQNKKKSIFSTSNRLKYVSGKESGLQPRGNVLLGQDKYILSLKPNWFHKLLFRLFF